MFQRIELNTGLARSGLPLRLLLLAWGGLAILSSASPWQWTTLAFLGLFLVDRLVGVDDDTPDALVARNAAASTAGGTSATGRVSKPPESVRLP